MKKLTLVLVMVFAAGFMFAQTNYALVSQSGNWNTADVTQLSLSCAPARINVLDFYQSGNHNFLFATQTAWTQNVSTGFQSGNCNYAEVDQKSPNNDSYLWQSGNWNVMKLDQDDFFGTYWCCAEADNYARNVQSGNHNRYYMDQEGQNNVEYLYQSGCCNIAYLDQYALDGAKSNWSRISQTGCCNWADLDQIGDYPVVAGHNTSYAYQVGCCNVVRVAQIGQFFYNFSRLSQPGNVNFAFIYQKTWYNNTSLNYAAGFGNYVKVVQYSWGTAFPHPWWF
jgi:hypothetical protein